MGRDEARAMVACMLDEARAIRAAFPDVGAMRDLPVSTPPPGRDDADGPPGALRAALGYLRDEMLVVRAGRAADLGVLDDEIANVARLLPGL